MEFFKQKNQLGQRGNVLLLSMLIMSGLVVGGFILGSVVVSEIRQSRQLDNATVAYYAAESGAEYALWHWRDTKCGNCTETLQDIKNCLYDQSSQIGWLCAHNQTTNVTQANFSLAPLQVEQIPLYIPDSLNEAANASLMRITWHDKNQDLVEPWLEVSLIGWPAANLIDYNNQKEIFSQVYKCLRPDPSKSDCTVINVALNQNYSYIVRLRSLYDQASDIQVRFFADSGGETDLNLKRYIRSVDFFGYFKGVKQGIRVQYPLVTPTSAMFDFILFSENSLLKKIF